MRNLRIAATATLIAATMALAGCATAADESMTPMTDASPSASSGDRATPSSSESSSEPMTDPEDAAEMVGPGAYVEYTDGAIEATAGSKALFFHASWCPKCRALDEDLKAQGAPDGLTVFKVDYDSRTDLRQKYGVTQQTTIVFVDDAGAALSSTVLYDDPSVASLVAAMP